MDRSADAQETPAVGHPPTAGVAAAAQQRPPATYDGFPPALLAREPGVVSNLGRSTVSLPTDAGASVNTLPSTGGSDHHHDDHRHRRHQPGGHSHPPNASYSGPNDQPTTSSSSETDRAPPSDEASPAPARQTAEDNTNHKTHKNTTTAPSSSPAATTSTSAATSKARLACHALASAVVQQPTAPSSSSLRKYSSAAVPGISLDRYAAHLAARMEHGEAGILLGLCLIMRVWRTHRAAPSPDTLHRLLLAATTVAMKAHFDDFYVNKYMARIGGLETARELGELEAHMFLTLLGGSATVRQKEIRATLDGGLVPLGKQLQRGEIDSAGARRKIDVLLAEDILPLTPFEAQVQLQQLIVARSAPGAVGGSHRLPHPLLTPTASPDSIQRSSSSRRRCPHRHAPASMEPSPSLPAAAAVPPPHPNRPGASPSASVTSTGPLPQPFPEFAPHPSSFLESPRGSGGGGPDRQDESFASASFVPPAAPWAAARTGATSSVRRSPPLSDGVASESASPTNGSALLCSSDPRRGRGREGLAESSSAVRGSSVAPPGTRPRTPPAGASSSLLLSPTMFAASAESSTGVPAHLVGTHPPSQHRSVVAAGSATRFARSVTAAPLPPPPPTPPAAL